MLRKLPLLVCISALAACGFQPVYSTSRVESSDLSQIAVSPMPERTGQLLRNTLLDRGFGDAIQSNDTRLSFVDIQESEVDLGLAPDNTATRRQLTITGTLIVTQKDKTLISRKLSTRSTYNVLVSQYGTIVSKENAQKLAINDLAGQIETQVALRLGEQAP